ncbi:MAG: O-methyltransferase [Clostridiales bacterium]|jgi:predicted O-methyltransferase YrrM|nr:O-methyltransferase [Clostridiales bacterium]
MDILWLRRHAEENGIPVIREDTEKLLRVLIGLKRPKKILEIGTATGYSAAVMLSCGDPSSRIYTIEKDEEKYLLAKQNLGKLGLIGRATLFLGDAGEILKSLTGSYDFIFVDGPKGQYLYFLPYLLGVIGEGGALVCDDVNYRGLVDGRVRMRRNNLTLINNLREFLKQVESHRLDSCVLDVGEGVLVSVHRG